MKILNNLISNLLKEKKIRIFNHDYSKVLFCNDTKRFLIANCIVEDCFIDTREVFYGTEDLEQALTIIGYGVLKDQVLEYKIKEELKTLKKNLEAHELLNKTPQVHDSISVMVLKDGIRLLEKIVGLK